MVESLIAAATSGPAGVDLNSLVTGGAGATLVGLLYFIIKLVLDRTIPSRSDARANVSMVLDGMSNMVKVLQEEKTADAKRLRDKQERIDQLEDEADKDYDRITELRNEIIELRNRLALKDRHINALVSELRKLGAQVSGLGIEGTQELEITHSPEEVAQYKAEAEKATPTT